MTIQPLIVEIVLGLIGLLLAIVGFFVSLGIKRLLSGQDAMVITHNKMNEQLTRTCGNVETSNARLEAKQHVCNERHEKNDKEHGQLHDAIEALRT